MARRKWDQLGAVPLAYLTHGRTPGEVTWRRDLVPCPRGTPLRSVSPVQECLEKGAPAMTTAAITAGLDGPATFLTWGPLQISVANLVTIAFIVVLFVLAIVLPFPKPRSRR